MSRFRIPRPSLIIGGLAFVLSACSASASGVTTPKPSPADIPALTKQFDSFEGLPGTCSGQLVAGSVHLATITATGTSWAVASFQRPEGCVYFQAPLTPGGPPRTVPLDQIGSWSDGHPVTISVFERAPNGPWIMNGEPGLQLLVSGRPYVPPTDVPAGAVPREVDPAQQQENSTRVVFPCDVEPGGRGPGGPGDGNAALPSQVIAAWHLKPQPATTCRNLSYAMAAR